MEGMINVQHESEEHMKSARGRERRAVRVCDKYSAGERGKVSEG